MQRVAFPCFGPRDNNVSQYNKLRLQRRRSSAASAAPPKRRKTETGYVAGAQPEPQHDSFAQPELQTSVAGTVPHISGDGSDAAGASTSRRQSVAGPVSADIIGNCEKISDTHACEVGRLGTVVNLNHDSSSCFATSDPRRECPLYRNVALVGRVRS